MRTAIQSLPDDALRMRFLQAARSRDIPDGRMHTKIVPYTIVAQPLQGRYEVRYDNGMAWAGPEEAVIVPANTTVLFVHHGDPKHGGTMRSRWLHIHFTVFEIIDFSSLLLLPRKLNTDEARPFGRIIEALLELRDKAKNPLVALAKRRELALTALQRLVSCAEIRPESAELVRSSERLTPAFRLVREQLHEPLSASTLARAAGMSRSRFHAFFRERMGVAPMEYVKTYRLDEARRQLAGTDRLVYHVAESCGFRNAFHFSRAFKARFGMSPSAYRATHGLDTAT